MSGRRLLKRLLIIFGIFFLVLVLALLAVTSLFEEPLGRRIISEVNKQITTELRVGGFDLSFITTFPNLSVNLRDVELDGLNGEPLLVAEQLSFRAGVFSFLGSSIKVKSMLIADGLLDVKVSPSGQTNYDILVPGDATDVSTGSETAIDLREALLRNVRIQYDDAAADRRLRWNIHEAGFNGQFSSTQYTLRSQAETLVEVFAIGQDRYVLGKPFSYDAALDINTETGLYLLEDVSLQLGELPLQATGSIQMGGETTEYDLQLRSDDGTLSALLDATPSRYLSRLDGLDTRGDFSLAATIQGTATESENPRIDASVNFLNGELSGDRMDGELRDLSFTALFTNGRQRNNRSSVFEIQNLKGYFQRELLEMRLRIENLDEPEVDFAANGAIGMGVLAGLIPDERVTGGQGEVELANLKLRGRYADMISTSRINRVTSEGALVFDDAGLTIKGEKLILDRGRLTLRDNTLALEDLRLQGPGTDLEFRGSAYNLIPVLFADSLNTRGAELSFTAELMAQSLDIDALLALGAPSEQARETAEAAGQADSLAQAEVEKRAFAYGFLNGSFTAKIGEFNYGKIEGRDFDGKLILANGALTIQGLTEAMGGQFRLDGEMSLTGRPALEAKLTCNEVDVNTFFTQAENFGQDVLRAEHLSGNIDALIYIEAHWDERGQFLDDRLRVLAGLGIKEGELKGFEMLEEFSQFVNIRDLRTIQFTNLQNFLEVRNRKLFIPVMFIQSNALNLTISGEHSFDQDIAYYLKVNAGQVLTDRFRRHDPTLRPKPARRGGFFNLYYSILGDIDNYNFSSDKRRVQSDFEMSEIRKQDIRFELERLFGTIIELVEEPVDWRDIPEYPADPDSEEPAFLDLEIEGGGG